MQTSDINGVKVPFFFNLDANIQSITLMQHLDIEFRRKYLVSTTQMQHFFIYLDANIWYFVLHGTKTAFGL